MRRLCVAVLILLLTLPATAQDLDSLFQEGMQAIQEASVTTNEERREELLDEAIAMFRDMLVADPNLVRVRLELARAFFLKGEDSLARRHFEAVLAGGVPDAVAANVHRFLAEIRARRRWSFNAGFAIAPDSNIGAGSDDRTIYIFGLPFQRDAQELTSSGVGLVLWGGGEYHYPLNDRTRLRAGGNLSRREHGGSQFDEASVSAHLGPRILLDERTEASVLATAGQRWVGTVKDHHALGGHIEAGHRVSRTVTVNGRATWEDRHYRTRTSLDGAAGDLSLGGAWVVPATLLRVADPVHPLPGPIGPEPHCRRPTMMPKSVNPVRLHAGTGRNGMNRRLTAIVERDGGGYVALCPEVGVASQGDSVTQARSNLEEALTLFFETASPEEIERRTRSEFYVTHVEVTVG